VVPLDLSVPGPILDALFTIFSASFKRNPASGLEPLVFVQRQLGHSSIQTTMVYLHLVNEMADEAVLAYDDELNALAGT
jgi:integrase